MSTIYKIEEFNETKGKDDDELGGIWELHVETVENGWVVECTFGEKEEPEIARYVYTLDKNKELMDFLKRIYAV